jgi:hypothetical protein
MAGPAWLPIGAVADVGRLKAERRRAHRDEFEALELADCLFDARAEFIGAPGKTFLSAWSLHDAGSLV